MNVLCYATENTFCNLFSIIVYFRKVQFKVVCYFAETSFNAFSRFVVNSRSLRRLAKEFCCKFSGQFGFPHSSETYECQSAFLPALGCWELSSFSLNFFEQISYTLKIA